MRLVRQKAGPIPFCAALWPARKVRGNAFRLFARGLRRPVRHTPARTCYRGARSPRPPDSLVPAADPRETRFDSRQSCARGRNPRDDPNAGRRAAANRRDGRRRPGAKERSACSRAGPSASKSISRWSASCARGGSRWRRSTGAGRAYRERALRDRFKGHVENFAQYDTDLATFMQEIVLPDCPPPHFALGHSAGATVLLRAAHRGKRWFDRIVLTSPMIQLAEQPMLGLAAPVARTLHTLGFGAPLRPGGGPAIAHCSRSPVTCHLRPGPLHPLRGDDRSRSRPWSGLADHCLGGRGIARDG